MRCLRCGNDNLEPAQLCQVCGTPLPVNGEPLGHSAGDSGEQPLVGLLYRALVGPVHTDYYLRQFARFDAAGKAAMSWHWPAFFATLGWLVFRRLWREALLFAGLSVTAGVALFSLAALVWSASPEVLWALLGVFIFVQSVLPALWANALYYRHCNRQVTQELTAASDIRQTYERLAVKASSRQRAWVVTALTAGVWLVALAVGAWRAGVLPDNEGVTPTTGKASAASSPTPPRASAPVMDLAASAAAPASSAPLAPSVPASAAVAMPASVPTSAPAATPTASTPKSATAASAPATAASVAALPKKEAVSATPAASAAQGDKNGKFVVAVGQFAKEQNADRAYSKLEAAGLPVHSNTVQTPNGTLALIRVGPFKTLQDARQAAQQIKELGLPAVVMKR